MNKMNHPMSGNSHPSVTANKSRLLAQKGGGYKTKGHHIILTYDEVVNLTVVKYFTFFAPE